MFVGAGGLGMGFAVDRRRVRLSFWRKRRRVLFFAELGNRMDSGWHHVLDRKGQKANQNRLRDELAQQSGIAINSQLFHWEWESGLALNEEKATLTVSVGKNIKTYKFTDIREWAVRSERAGQVVPMGGGLAGGIAAGAANIGASSLAAAHTGLFISVKDINFPTWRISMQSKAKRDSWFEILTQALNEGGTSAANN